MSAHTLDVLLAVLGGFLMGWNPWTRRDARRMNWLVEQRLYHASSNLHLTRTGIDAAIAAEEAYRG